MSVPFPAEARLDGPAGQAAYSRYLVDCQAADRRETADEAIARCRAEADLLDQGGARFDDVLDCLTTTFDRHVADVNGPHGDQWKGFTFEESSFYGVWQIDRLRRAYVEMSGAFIALDRERFRKAAAMFAEVVADWGITWKPRAKAAEGGAR